MLGGPDELAAAAVLSELHFGSFLSEYYTESFVLGSCKGVWGVGEEIQSLPLDVFTAKGAMYVNNKGISRKWDKGNGWFWADYGIHSYKFPNELLGWCRKIQLMSGGTKKRATSSSAGIEQEPNSTATEE